MTFHIAILHEPYLSRILNGEKTIESRWLKRRVAPYDHIRVGDIIYFKQASGPIVATAHAAEVWQFADLTPQQVDAILEQFGDELQLDPDFADRARDQRYAVLIRLADVQQLSEPLFFRQRGRSGWVVLDQSPVGRSSSQ